MKWLGKVDWGYFYYWDWLLVVVYMYIENNNVSLGKILSDIDIKRLIYLSRKRWMRNSYNKWVN